MRIVIMDSLGKAHTSDMLTKSDMIAQFSGKYAESYAKDAYGEMVHMFKNFKNLNYLSLTVLGEAKYFNPVHVVWVQVIEPIKEWEDA